MVGAGDACQMKSGLDISRLKVHWSSSRAGTFTVKVPLESNLFSVNYVKRRTTANGYKVIIII